MAAFEYQAKSATGKDQKGVIEADSIRQAREKLLQQQLIPIRIQAVKTRHQRAFWQRWKSQLNTKALVGITRQLSTLLTAGVPLDEALSAIIEQQTKQHVRSIMLGVRAKVLEGLSLSQALSAFPDAFPAIYRTTIAAGEKAGRLDQVLNELASYTNKQQRLQQQIQQAMLYPLVMLVVSLSVVTYLLSAVVPKILQVVQDAHQALPWQTVALLNISHAITHDGLWILLGLLALIAGCRYLLKQPKIKAGWHRLLTRLPLIGQLLMSLNVARFARTLSIATSAGVPILEALASANRAINLMPMQTKIATAMTEIKEGTSLHHAFRRTGAFAPTFVYLIASGEASGQLDHALSQAADDEQHQLESWIKSALTLFEPIMILLMGGIVLFIVLAVLIPIFNLDQIAGG